MMNSLASVTHMKDPYVNCPVHALYHLIDYLILQFVQEFPPGVFPYHLAILGMSHGNSEHQMGMYVVTT